MKVLLKAVFLLFFVFITNSSFCQEPLVTDKIEDKVVIGFPGITTTQLNLIKEKFLANNAILTAKYITGDHNCMLITFDINSKQFSVYGEVLKTISQHYDIDNCYFKPTTAYAEILGNVGNATVFDLK
ncbi:MAG: hypothetical protein ABIP51_11310 [Bacteroidia bacterium]